MAIHMIDVNPRVLEWAREAVGLSVEEAATKLDMSVVDLRKLEVGVGDVPESRLRKMAQLYDRPYIAFFLDDPPPASERPPDFRPHPESRNRRWSLALHRAYRRVASQRLILQDLAELAAETPRPIELRLTLDESPEDAGRHLRKWLGPPPMSGRLDGYSIFNAWREAVEDKAILVTQISGVPVSEMRGFSIGTEPFPAIALNGKDDIRARTFTLIHELVHILLRRGGVCDLDDSIDSSTAAERIERFCNAVAAAALMPRDTVLAEALVIEAAANSTWGDDRLRTLAARYGVSEQAILLRLVTLGKASRSQYVARMRWMRRIEENAKDTEEDDEQGFPGYYPIHVRNLGRRFVQSVLGAHESGDISSVAMARYLGIKLGSLPKLLDALNPRG